MSHPEISPRTSLGFVSRIHLVNSPNIIVGISPRKLSAIYKEFLQGISKFLKIYKKKSSKGFLKNFPKKSFNDLCNFDIDFYKDFSKDCCRGSSKKYFEDLSRNSTTDFNQKLFTDFLNESFLRFFTGISPTIPLRVSLWIALNTVPPIIPKNFFKNDLAGILLRISPFSFFFWIISNNSFIQEFFKYSPSSFYNKYHIIFNIEIFESSLRKIPKTVAISISLGNLLAFL